jgi:hypothetical protein
MSRKNTLPLSSGSKRNPCEKPAEAGGKLTVLQPRRLHFLVTAVRSSNITFKTCFRLFDNGIVLHCSHYFQNIIKTKILLTFGEFL